MPASKKSTHTTWIDPDEAPELNDEWFEKAELLHGEEVVRRGRPKPAASNVTVILRIPLDVPERGKSTGPGWQTRMVASLKNHAPKGSSHT
jgi:uncharacterized protein (DUF4415 family)